LQINQQTIAAKVLDRKTALTGGLPTSDRGSVLAGDRQTYPEARSPDK